MKRLLCLSAALLACATLVPSPAGAQSIACAAQVPSASKGHWYYRLIDGRKCWYEGKSLIPKSMLYWPTSNATASETARRSNAAAIETATPSVRPAVRPAAAVTAPQAVTDGRNISAQSAATPAAAPTAKPDGWPTPAVEDGSFEARWRAIRSGS